MALDTNVGNILTQQINKEFYSAYLYLTFADFYEEQGLKGFANWYVIQSQEELAHARILRRFSKKKKRRFTKNTWNYNFQGKTL